MTGVGPRAIAAVSPFGAGFLANLSGTPWGVTVVISLGVLLVALVCAVMPQESGDRLAWWQSFWARSEPPRIRVRSESEDPDGGTAAGRPTASEPPGPRGREP